MPNVTETFNKADSTTLGPNLTWTEYVVGGAGNGLQVVGNAARVNAVNTDTFAICAEQTTNNPKRTVVTVKTFNTPPSGTTAIYLGVRSAATYWSGARIAIASDGTCTVEEGYVIEASGGWNGTSIRTITKPTVPFDFSYSQDAQSAWAFQIKINDEIMLNYRHGSNADTNAGFGVYVSASGAVGDVEIDAFASYDNTLSATVPYLVETFNSPDSTTIGATCRWDGETNLQTVGNACRAETAATFGVAYSQVVYAQTQKATEITVKTFANPSSGSNYVYAIIGYADPLYAARIGVNSAGVCTVEFGTLTAANVWTSKGGVDGTSGATTITKPTAPFTFRCQMDSIGTRASIYVNGMFVAYGLSTGASSTGWGSFGLYANSNVADVEIDQVRFDFNVLQRPLSTFAWPTDGIGYFGPFISSTGNVCVAGLAASGGFVYPGVWVASNPTESFTQYSTSTQLAQTGTPMAVVQSGDLLYCSWQSGSSGSATGRVFNMTTNTWGTAAALWTGVLPVNFGLSMARRSNGDIIMLYNTAGVTNMGKTYGRIAARRVVGFPATAGTETQIGILMSATTLQSESVDSVCLGTSDRVHLFWGRNFLASTGVDMMQRTVKSTDNLGGTQPATAAQTLGMAVYGGNTADTPQHLSGQVFCSSAGVLSLPFVGNVTFGMEHISATSADTPSWSPGALVGAQPRCAAAGTTFASIACGGAPFDGVSQYMTWVGGNSQDPIYNDNPTPVFDGWNTATASTITTTTSTQISSNIYTRGTNVMLAMVYDLSTNNFVYDEIVLRSTGPATQTTSISPAIFTLTPVALTESVGDVSRLLTPTTFTLTPVALVRSIGTVTTSISPATFTLTAVALTGSISIPDQPTSISPVIFTLTSVVLTESIGNVSRAITPATFTLTPVALTKSIGDANRTLTAATFTLTPVALVRSVGAISTSITSVTVTLTPIALTISVGTSSYTLTPATFTLTTVAFTTSVSTSSRTLTPVTFTLIPVALAIAGGPSTSSISPVIFTLTPIALARTLGTSSATLSSAIFTLTTIALTTSVGGTATTSITPATLFFSPVVINAFSATPGAGTIFPATFVLSPVALTRSVGPISTSITRATFTLTPVALVRGTDTVSRTITPTTFTLSAVALTRGIDTVSRTITPATVTLTAITLTRSVGTASGSLSPTIFTLTPVALTRSIGTVTYVLTPVTMTLTPVFFTRSIGTATLSIDPTIFTLVANKLVLSGFGGRPYVWMGTEWLDKPVKRWTGTAWVEEPMKVWTGSSWELV